MDSLLRRCALQRVLLLHPQGDARLEARIRRREREILHQPRQDHSGDQEETSRRRQGHDWLCEDSQLQTSILTHGVHKSEQLPRGVSSRDGTACSVRRRSRK